MVTGDRGNGKSRVLLKSLLKATHNRGIRLNYRKNIIYTDVTGFDTEILTSKNMIKGIDEGYWGAYNLDVNSTPVKNLTQNLTAARNRGHIIIINFVKLTRAAKPLLEIANFWIHKPNLENAILYIRDREFIGNDPWSVEDLLKANTLGQKRYLLRHNPNYICTMRIKEVPQRIFDKYEAIKLEEQSKLARTKQLVKESQEREIYIMAQLHRDFKAGLFSYDTLKLYLRDNYHVPPIFLERYANKFRSYLIEKQFAERINEQTRLNEAVG